ncbi:MAG: sulfatase-like hydrolase/transferase, partial [Candidatus Latescibacterota bacterium]|nr:sulfatase-like hydrolase/transferase [Candidatus Latescibacterota bacterium]
MDRPNILFICTDQQSRTAMGAAGNPWVDTPHMDSLAAEGVRFTDAYCGSPVCGPSRACLLTGRMSHDHGVLVNGMTLRAKGCALCDCAATHADRAV